ncbi:hypothetical protein [Microbacterium sp. JZ31]|uniref:hypothetical protein n=1 Tax=Microbacterium sp. JZ31 TaxID=1906274 RepID=UPI001933F177|nr:hypothetical protein [Microbacterium sp. JZ31]
MSTISDHRVQSSSADRQQRKNLLRHAHTTAAYSHFDDEYRWISPSPEASDMLGIRKSVSDYSWNENHLLFMQAMRAGQWVEADINDLGSAARHVKVSPSRNDSIAVRAHQETGRETMRGYYVSRTYRGLWFGLLMLALVWGVMSGVALSTGTLLSPAAVLMGILGTVVLAATLVSAGSRDRIRRKRS